MGDIPGIVVITAGAMSWAMGHLIRRVGEGVVRGNTARWGESSTRAAKPVVADDGIHRVAAGRRDHRL